LMALCGMLAIWQSVLVWVRATAGVCVVGVSSV